METIIHDTTVVTADDACTVQYDAALAVVDDRIAAIGPTAELLARYPAAERVDGRGKAVMPGFTNLHTRGHGRENGRIGTGPGFATAPL